ncbi:GNAT family N-acetyltransferase [Ulvibacterium marinum]|uniref:GNAT family N-acetyltransferase n=1 Tax=Ulvibacterium marinum TaxID=2419782 RepID=A0A3B0CA33_9FLAO|nr:GNAT family N-acetyltransferase [Ulvibacterium marinum]RKN81891.1 GNAT family N-acetyltransferase [Ulvibacterium marinum]
MNIRIAVKSDLLDIVSLLAHDKLGKSREDFQDPLPKKYYDAFKRINSDPHQELVVIVDDSKKIIGTLQLSFIPYLTYQGGIRAQIEAVRVHEQYRGQGVGQRLFEWAIQRSKEKGAHLVQLTTDKKRQQALAFYKKLGFTNSHEGMKLHLT